MSWYQTSSTFIGSLSSPNPRCLAIRLLLLPLSGKSLKQNMCAVFPAPQRCSTNPSAPQCAVPGLLPNTLLHPRVIVLRVTSCPSRSNVCLPHWTSVMIQYDASTVAQSSASVTDPSSGNGFADFKNCLPLKLLVAPPLVCHSQVPPCTHSVFHSLVILRVNLLRSRPRSQLQEGPHFLTMCGTASAPFFVRGTCAGASSLSACSVAN